MWISSTSRQMWSSLAKLSYIAITIHYLTDSFEIRSHLLETKEMHTGDMIAESLLMNKSLLLAATTDNGSNIVFTLRKLAY